MKAAALSREVDLVKSTCDSQKTQIQSLQSLLANREQEHRYEHCTREIVCFISIPLKECYVMACGDGSINLFMSSYIRFFLPLQSLNFGITILKKIFLNSTFERTVF